MKNITTIVLIVWAICYAICVIDISIGLYKAVKSRKLIHSSYYIDVSLRCLFMAPVVASFILADWLFQLADWMYHKAHLKNED